MRSGFDIAVTSEDFGGAEDRRWLGARMGTKYNRSITLDPSKFVAAHLTAKGALPSGTILAKVTATGKYGPYDPAAGDGRNVAAGLLFNTQKLGDGTGNDLATAAPIGAPLFWSGIVKEAFLPLFAGTVAGELDAAARTALSTHIRFEA